jgi:hypothetical protein
MNSILFILFWMLFLKINGNNIKFTSGYSILQICDSVGVRIPRFCYNDQLSIAGNCRMCLVEMKGGPKPLVSCTSKGIPHIEVYTESPLVKKTREGVVEFLLLNHPLDCPICDQGGECDLQDQSEEFGGDCSRNTFLLKRPLQDKDMGVFIKTIMNRCIHCTRCIRFLREKAFISGLGAIGRGESTEISFYFKTFLSKSFLLGNIVDVCPVGALTSKNYSFKARPWEVFEVKHFGVSDTLGLGFKLSIQRGTGKLFRITPTFSKDTGTNFISDFSRHCVGGIALDRIRERVFRSGMSLKLSLTKPNTLSSVLLFKGLSGGLKGSLRGVLETFNIAVGPYISIKKSFLLLFKNSETGLNSSYHVSFSRTVISTLYPFLYSSNTFIGKFIVLDLKGRTSFYGSNNCFSSNNFNNRYFSIGVDFTSEFPSLISKVFFYGNKQKAFAFCLLPYSIKDTFYPFKKGISSSGLINIIEGRSALSKKICKTFNYFLFFSMLLKRRLDGAFLHSSFNKISFVKNLSGVLSSVSSETLTCDLFLNKNVALKRFCLFNDNNSLELFFLNNSNELFKKQTFLKNLNIFSELKKTIQVLIGEVGEKSFFVLKHPWTLIRIHLSSFNSRITKFKTPFRVDHSHSILGQLILPKPFFTEESFGFISTLGIYKKNSWYNKPPRRNGLYQSKKNRLGFNRNLLCLNRNVLGALHIFVLSSDKNTLKSGLKSFPIYSSSGHLYLTEIKSVSKENLFKEDSFLNKCPHLIRILRDFRQFVGNFSS